MYRHRRQAPLVLRLQRPDHHPGTDLHPARRAEAIGRLHRRHGLAGALRQRPDAGRGACRAGRARASRGDGPATERRLPGDPDGRRSACCRAQTPLPSFSFGTLGQRVRGRATPRRAHPRRARRRPHPPSTSPSLAASASPAPIPSNTECAEIERALVARFGEAEGGRPRSVTTVGPLIGSELIRSSIILIVVGELFILAYLWIRFGFRFGTAAIVALLHDVIVVVGDLRDPGLLLRRRVRRPVRHRAADDHRLQRARHDRGLRPHPREPHPPRRGAVRGDRQPFDPADARAARSTPA